MLAERNCLPPCNGESNSSELLVLIFLVGVTHLSKFENKAVVVSVVPECNAAKDKGWITMTGEGRNLLSGAHLPAVGLVEHSLDIARSQNLQLLAFHVIVRALT